MNEFLTTISRTREYLDYLENHYKDVQKAYSIMTSDDIKNIASTGNKHIFKYLFDDKIANDLKTCVEKHDLSKLSEDEFIAYRKKFFPIHHSESNNFKTAWNHHKKYNNHHWENWLNMKDDYKRYIAIIHNFIDWFAMSLRFNDGVLDYYYNNVDKINIPKEALNIFITLNNALIKIKTSQQF